MRSFMGLLLKQDVCCNPCIYRTAALTLAHPGMTFAAPSLHADSQSQWWLPLAFLHNVHLFHGTLDIPAALHLRGNKGMPSWSRSSASGQWQAIIIAHAPPTACSSHLRADWIAWGAGLAGTPGIRP